MHPFIEKLRQEYGNHPLLESDLKEHPIDQFLVWFQQAMEAEVKEPNGMVLSTVSATGFPSARTVLLKKVDYQGFVFFTSANSRKGKQLKEHSFAALTFWWKEIYRQVQIEGKVVVVERHEVEDYFSKRPRGAQLAAHASSQSDPLATREELEEAFEAIDKHYEGKEIPCPKEWCGYRVIPERVELWQGRADRLHDRFVYVLAPDNTWLISRLYP